MRRIYIRKTVQDHITRLLKQAGQGHLEGHRASPWKPKARTITTRTWIASSILGRPPDFLARYQKLAVLDTMTAAKQLAKEAWAEVKSEASLSTDGSSLALDSTIESRRARFMSAAIQTIARELDRLDRERAGSVSTTQNGEGSEQPVLGTLNPHRMKKSPRAWQNMWRTVREPGVTIDSVQREIDCIEQLSSVVTPKSTQQMSSRKLWRDRTRGRLRVLKERKPNMTVAEAVMELTPSGARFSRKW
jgi:hypothetical protein